MGGKPAIKPSTGSNRGSKRRRSGKEPDSTSAPKEKTSKTIGKSTEGSKSHHKSASESAPADEPVHTTKDLEEPTHQDLIQTLPATHGPIHHWISNLAGKDDSRTSFNELMDTPLDFSAFVMNRLKVDTLTSELLAGPTYELMKGSCKSLVELEFFHKEVYKVTTNQLDWNNPEGQQYPHDLRKLLPPIPTSQGRRIIPFNHFINNDLSIYVVVSQDEYWITVRRDDEKLYKIKEGDFKRLRIHDIKDMLLLLVQGKLTNLTIDERLAFNVSLRMFTRSIVIKRRMEDLQLGLESYQKKINLTNLNTSDLKQKEAYTAYSNPIGFIYQNKDKQNRLMRINELHKFSDGTLNDVRTALDDCLKGIRMQYLSQTIWRRSDKDRATAMIQAIDKQLKTRRIMRSLEKFVGGRLYERDFRLL
nr:hypothetical protein [Tanacetum cinerariifolium]